MMKNILINNYFDLNVIWHIISDPRDIDFFFAYVKKPKICKLLDAQ